MDIYGMKAYGMIHYAVFFFLLAISCWFFAEICVTIMTQYFFYYIFMQFPVCQIFLKDCVDFLCVNNQFSDNFIEECVEFYNESLTVFGLK